MKNLFLFLVCFSNAVLAGSSVHRVDTAGAIRSSNKLSDKAADTLEKIFVLADELEVVHTTREMTPKLNEGFPAGRYAVVLKTSGEEKRFLVLQTESKVGHLKPVIPGKTKVDGYVTLVDSRAALTTDNAGEQLQTHQLRNLCVRLLKLWGRPEAMATENEKLTLQALLAIYTNGNGEALKKLYLEAGK